MLNSRFAEISRRPDAPFLRASTGDDTLGRTVEAVGVSARVNDGAMEKGLNALAQELARMRQYGFGEAELDRSKRAAMATYERAYNERDKSQSGGYASELVRYFLEGEPAPGIENEIELVRKLLPTITAAELGALREDDDRRRQPGRAGDVSREAWRRGGDAGQPERGAARGHRRDRRAVEGRVRRADPHGEEADAGHREGAARDS